MAKNNNKKKNTKINKTLIKKYRKKISKLNGGSTIPQQPLQHVNKELDKHVNEFISSYEKSETVKASAAPLIPAKSSAAPPISARSQPPISAKSPPPIPPPFQPNSPNPKRHLKPKDILQIVSEKERQVAIKQPVNFANFSTNPNFLSMKSINLNVYNESNTNNSDDNIIKHFWYRGWPEHSAPNLDDEYQKKKFL